MEILLPEIEDWRESLLILAIHKANLGASTTLSRTVLACVPDDFAISEFLTFKTNPLIDVDIYIQLDIPENYNPVCLLTSNSGSLNSLIGRLRRSKIRTEITIINLSSDNQWAYLGDFVVNG